MQIVKIHAPDDELSRRIRESDSNEVEESEVKWTPDTEALFLKARQISRELGHGEIISPLHLLAGLMVFARPRSVLVPQIEWGVARTLLNALDPPWEDGLVVLSPGGHTPTTKRILFRAVNLAMSEGVPVETGHIWDAAQQCEPTLVAAVLAKFGEMT